MGHFFFLFKTRIPGMNIFFQLFLSIHEVKFRVRINIIIFLKRNSLLLDSHSLKKYLDK